jgi:hypothetical protein
VFQKTGANRFAEVGSRRPIRARAGAAVLVRVRLGTYKRRGAPLSLDIAFRMPRGRAGAFGTLELVGGASAFSEDIFCLFDPDACGEEGSVKSFTQVVQALGRQPRNNQLIATMTIDPAPGRPGRPAVTRKVRTATQIVTGQRSIPVVVTR